MSMRMRTAFLLASMVGFLLFLLGVWALTDSYLRIVRMNELQQATGRVIGDGRRLALLSHDLMLRNEIRLQEQRRGLHEDIEASLLSRQEKMAAFKQEIANIRHYMAVLDHDLSTYHADIGSASSEARQMLMTQNALRIDAVQSSFDELENAVRRTVDVELGTSGRGLIAKFGLLFAVCVVAVITIWWFFYLRMQRPLLDLESGIQRIHAGDLDFRPSKAAADEIGSVVDAFNGLLDQQQAMAEDLAAKNRLFAIISRLQEQFISEPEPGVMFDKLLQDIIALTGSEFGLLGEVLPDEGGGDFLKVYACSAIDWDAATRFRTLDADARIDHPFRRLIEDRAVVMASDAAYSRHDGPAEECPIIQNFQRIPVWYGERLVGEIGLANRPGGYGQDLLDYIQPVVEACGRIIVARRDRDARELAEFELRRYKDGLEVLVAERTGQLEQARDAAEAANRAKSSFLANMSHELRTPMNAIMGMTSMALRQATDPKLCNQLDKVQQASQHLLAIINDILDISKIEAERMVLEQTNFMLGEVMEKVVSLTSGKVDDKHLELRLNMQSEVDNQPFVGDPHRLAQILLNLVANGVKFTSKGTITVRAGMIEESATDMLLRFEVQDSGIGISADDQKRLFSAFEQADSSMTRKYGGTGLGLVISKRLTQMMGGEIGVDSEIGAGSTFWFTARLIKAAEVVRPLRAAPADAANLQIKARYAGAAILLAEDDPINREIAWALLDDAGLDVDLAEDGQEAVRLAEHKHYDLILMDMQMPELNGVDATRAIRALASGAATPIIALTANAFDEDRQVCLEAGMNDHIAKPFSPEVLFSSILKWLEKSRA
jgi:signal transduction histidine kinase/HAMP domain-containing protein/ActR/RegA family two-component response regulator